LGSKKRGVNAAFFYARRNPGTQSNKPLAGSVIDLGYIFVHTLAFNLFLTRLFQTLDRISRYFKAKFSALIR
jgi:hypothetical protein